MCSLLLLFLQCVELELLSLWSVGNTGVVLVYSLRGEQRGVAITEHSEQKHPGLFPVPLIFKKEYIYIYTHAYGNSNSHEANGVYGTYVYCCWCVYIYVHVYHGVT